MQDWQTWFKNLIAKNYFFTKLTNTDEISSPIVKAIREKEIPVADYSSLLSAIESVREAIDEKNGVEEVTVKNLAEAKMDLTQVVEKLTAILNKEEKDVVFPEIKFPEQKETVIDLSPVVKALGKLEKSIPKYEKQEIADYTELLSQMVTLLDRKPTDLSKIESSLGSLSKTEDISILADWLKVIYEKEEKEFPALKFNKDGRLLVAVDKVGGGGGGGLTQIETTKLLTLATEEKQDDIIAAVSAIPGGGGTQYTEGDTDATITGTAALVEGAANALVPMTQPLTDTELRAADVKVTLDGESVPVTGTFYQATQPVSGTVTVGSITAGDNNIGNVDVETLPTDARQATAVDATASGDTTIVSITNSPRLYYVSLSANGANSADVTVIVRIGASAKYKVSLKAGAIWARNIGAGRNYITGSTGDDIIVNLSAAQTVHVSVEYADI